MYKAKEIAQWFVNKAYNDVQINGGEYMTHLKLQKLLYYAQGCSLALREKPLFNDAIENWTHGPVVPSVYAIYRDKKDRTIESFKEIEVDDTTSALLEEVYELFGQFSALKLREMTHREDPWKNTSTNETITQESIKTYFKKEYVTA